MFGEKFVDQFDHHAMQAWAVLIIWLFGHGSLPLGTHVCLQREIVIRGWQGSDHTLTPPSGRSPASTPCPLYPRKQTCAVQLGMSALGQKRTHAVQQNDTHWCLLDHLVRGAVGSSSAARCTIPRSFGSAKGTALSVRALYFRAVKTTKIGSKRPRKWTTSP